MSAEDRLRDLLREEADTLVPAGDGLRRIQNRVAQRRRRRAWLVPSAALVLAAAATGVFALSQTGQRGTQVLRPAHTPTAAPSSSASSLPAPQDSYAGEAIWPITSQAQADAWDLTAKPWAEDSLAMMRRFVSDVLQLPVTVTQPCLSCHELTLRVGSATVGRVVLAHYSSRGHSLFTIVTVTGNDLSITSPLPGYAISSPTAVSGRITGIDENVALQLVTDDGRTVASAGAPAGSAVPWSATLSWTANDWTAGGIVGVTRSAKDGSVNRVVATPVRRATVSATASFAGLVDGHVALFDGTTGKRLRQLTFPPAGSRDVELSWAAGTLAWVRTRGASACIEELDRLDGQAPSTVVRAGTVHLRTPTLSASGGLLAWVQQPCSGGPQEVVVTGGGSPDRHLAVPTGSTAEVFDLRDDGTILLQTHSGSNGPQPLRLMAGGATLSTATTLRAAAGCTLDGGGAFDGSNVVAFETCGGNVRLVHWDDKGVRGTVDKAWQAESPQSIAVRSGQVLVHVFGGDSYGSIARYADGATTTLIPNDGCTSVSSAKGCVSSPDW